MRVASTSNIASFTRCSRIGTLCTCSACGPTMSKRRGVLRQLAVGTRRPQSNQSQHSQRATTGSLHGDDQLAPRVSSCSTARRTQLETERSSAAARARTSRRRSSGNRTGTGSLSLALRRTGGPWGSGSPDRHRRRSPDQGSYSCWSSVLPIALGEVVGCDVATDGTAFGRVTGVRRCQGHREDFAGYLANHEPVGRWLGGIEQGFAVQTSLTSSNPRWGCL